MVREATAGDAQHVAVEKFRFPRFSESGDTQRPVPAAVAIHVKSWPSISKLHVGAVSVRKLMTTGTR